MVPYLTFSGAEPTFHLTHCTFHVTYPPRVNTQTPVKTLPSRKRICGRSHRSVSTDAGILRVSKRQGNLYYGPYPESHSTKTRTREMPQRARIFKVNCHLKVHNAHLNLLSPISG